MINPLNTIGDLAGLRLRVRQKSDAIPFLLLPVRLETRFMKVEQVEEESAGTEFIKVLESSSAVSQTLLADDSESSARSLGSAEKDMKKLEELLESAGPLSPVQVQELEDITRRLSESLAGEPAARAGGADQRLERLEKLREQIRKTPVKEDKRYEAGRKLVKSHERLLEAVKGIIEKQNEAIPKLPYTHPRHKRQLYGYLNKLLQNIQTFYRKQGDKFARIAAIDKMQLDALERQHKELKKTLPETVKALQEIHPDPNWQAYVRDWEQKINQSLPDLFEHFERQQVARLQFTESVKKTSADEVYLRGLRTQIWLDTYRRKGFTRYGLVKEARLVVKQKLEVFHNALSGQIEASPAQVAALQELGRKLASSLDKLAAKISTVKVINTSQAHGIRHTVNTFKQAAGKLRKRLGGLEAGKINIVSAEDVRRSAAFYQKTINRLDTLDETAGKLARKKKVSQEELDELGKKIQELSDAFLTGKRRKLVFSAEMRDELFERIEKLSDQLGRIKGLAEEHSVKRIKLMRDTLGALIVIRRSKGTGKKRQRAFTLTPEMEPSEEIIVISSPATVQDQLWVRIFPDDIFVHTHEKGLSAEEIRLGKDYWLSYWAASGDEDLELGAWKALVAATGTQRAAWIVRKLQPDLNGPFKNKPSAATVAAAAGLANVQHRLAPITEEASLGSVFDAIDEAAVAVDLANIQSRLAAISREQAYLLEKVADPLRQIESKLYLIQQKLQGISDDDAKNRAGEIDGVSQWFGSFHAIRDHLGTVVPQTSRQFIEAFNDPFAFPEAEQRSGDWTTAPQARVLPERFAVIAMTGSTVEHVAIGAALPQEPLQLGLDPEKFDLDDVYRLDESGNLIVDSGIRWMVDFTEAENRGMALRIPLTTTQAENGFDRVLVLGVREQGEGKALLEELLENHLYAPDGMELLPINTPTNNTGDGPSAFGALITDLEKAFRLQMGPLQFPTGVTQPLLISDGQRLATGLGIDPARLQRVSGAGKSEISEAMAMSRALAPATLDSYMEDIWDSVFTYDSIRRAHEFLVHNVAGRGLLPSLRIGSQPYGLLATTAYSQMRFDDAFDKDNLPPLTQAQLRFDIRLHQFLMKLHDEWTLLREQRVPYLGNVHGKDPQQHFMSMLGLHANSVDYYFRYGVNVAMRGRESEEFGFNINFRDDSAFGPLIIRDLFQDMMLDADFRSSFEFADELSPSSDPNEQLNRKTNRIRDQFQTARLFKSRFLDANPPLKGAFVTENPLSVTDALEHLAGTETNYIRWLLDHNPYQILASNQVAQLPDTSAFFLLLRQALLMAYRKAALGILQHEQFFTEPRRRSIGSYQKYRVFLNSPANPRFTYQSKWTYLFRDLEDINGLDFQDFSGLALYKHLSEGAREKSMVDYLYPANNGLFTSFPNHQAHTVHIQAIDEVRNAMQRLEQVPTANLHQLLCEHLDLFNYRLDAWIVGLAQRRLSAQRAANATGIHLGAYGWVEDLRPGGERTPAPQIPEGLDDGEGNPVFVDEDNEGFIHAPSLNHAIAAAILRSGYKANAEQENVSNNMAVNLCSRRVRSALSVLEGVRNGLPMSAVLGFQFERGLHERYAEAELDQFILPFRKAYPQSIPVAETASTNPHPAPETQVVNGQALLDDVNAVVDQLTFAPGLSLFDLLSQNNFQVLPNKIYQVVAGTTPRTHLSETQRRALTAVVREIDRMMDSLDAVGDLALSESVYQVVQGNHVRAAATVQALAEGKAMPDPQIVETPRTGTVVTQRVILHLPHQGGPPAAPAGWPATLTARAKAEPAVNHWLARWIGDPAKVRVLVEYTDDAGQNQLREVSLLDLGIQPIDMLHLVGANQSQASSELQARIAREVRQDNTLPVNVELRLKFRDRLAGWGAGIKTFYEMEALLDPLAGILAETRGIHAGDISTPPDDPDLDNPGRQDRQELETRVLGAHTALEAQVANTRNFIGTAFGESPENQIAYTSEHLQQLRQFLSKAAEYGLPHAIPDAAIEVSDAVGADLLRQSKAVLQAAGRRLKEAATKLQQYQLPGSTQLRVKLLEEIAKDVFGKNFVVLPAYQPDDLSAIQNQLNLPAPQGLLRSAGAGKEALTMAEWLQGIADVRPNLHKLEMAEMLAETFGHDFPEMAPVQFPYHQDDVWVGISYYPQESWSTEPEDEILSLVMVGHDNLQASAAKRVGILIDEWIEIIPNTRETTGIAFNYDRPDAEAPQSLLLAITPHETGQWAWDNLVHTLVDTLELAKNRAVEPDHLDESKFVQALPALVSEVVPPQMRDISDSNPLGTQVVLDYADNLSETVEEA